MGAQSSSDSSIREFSQTVVPYWNLVMDAFCGHIYLFIFFFFLRLFLGREVGERKIRDCGVNLQPCAWALLGREGIYLPTQAQMRSDIPNFAFLERFFHFPQGRGGFS